MNFTSCYIEYNEVVKEWFICFPDGSRADYQGYKTKGWATRALKRMRNS